MRLSSFFKLVEIQTKVASMIPFLLGIVFTIFRYHKLDGIRMMILFISMICIDMGTTAINNYLDNKRAIHKEGYNYESHNAIIRDGLTEPIVIRTIIMLFVVGGISGLVLVSLTDIVVLFIGLIGAFVGITYSYGPVPISRTPLGEIFSGVIMGGFIFFVTVYVQIYDGGYIMLFISDGIFIMNLDIKELVIIGVVSIPLILLIANIMLANNICDIEEDVINKRYTLPYYIGKKWALVLLQGAYVVSYMSILVAIMLKWLPLTCLLLFITIIPVVKWVRQFKAEQVKEKTFAIIVKSFMVIGGTYILTILLSNIMGMIIN